MKKEYSVLRKCKICDNIDNLFYSREEIAFSMVNSKISNMPCSKCHSISWASISYPSIKIDDDLMERWIKSPDLYFLVQDEGIYLAVPENLDLITRYIDQKSTLPYKQKVLMEAICILLYDSIINNEDEDLINKLKTIILERKSLLKTTNDFISDYIKEIIYPELEIQFEMMKIKVCGMKDPENINILSKLPVNYLGMIFYEKSQRFINNLSPEVIENLSPNINKVGVFVNTPVEIILEQINKYKLNTIQLHGDESPEYCQECGNISNVEIIKAFNIENAGDFYRLDEFEELCDFFLFDTKTNLRGGSGKKFDWTLLNAYKNDKPFFLSGGLSIEDIDEIKKIKHPKLYALDINSKFEIKPGLKNISLIDNFIKKIRNE